MSSLLKPWLVLAAIFIAGGLSGSALTFVLGPHFAHARQKPHDPIRLKKDMMDGLTHELNLTADQQTKIQPIIGEAAREVHEVHQDEMQRFTQIFKLTDEQIAPILTSDQKTQMEKLESEGGAGMLFGRPRGGPGDHPHGFGEPNDSSPPSGPAPGGSPPPASSTVQPNPSAPQPPSAPGK